MRIQTKLLGVLMGLFLGTWSLGALASEVPLLFSNKRAVKTSDNVLYLEQLPPAEKESASYLQFKVGASQYEQIQISNPYYDFRYPTGKKNISLSLAWEGMLAQAYGGWDVRVGVAHVYHSESMRLSGSDEAGRIRLHGFPLSAGLVYLADFHPAMKWFLPTLEVGGTYHAYFQTGDVDGTRSSGGGWLAHLSFGFRHHLDWLGLSHTQLVADYQRTRSLTSSGTNFSGSLFEVGLAAQL